MKTLLIMTVGQTDVQLVVDNVRYELLKKRCGTLHDELENRGFTIVEAPTTKEKDKQIETLPDGDLSVCTPKLDAVLGFFGESLPTHALIFDTRRTTPSDPRLAGQVLELRLKSRNIEVHRHTFLVDKEWLEDRSNKIDAVVRGAVVEKLDSALRLELDGTGFDRIVIAATGGLPLVNDVIKELVRLHAVGYASVTSLEVPDGSFADKDDRAVEEKFHPAAGYRARWHALSLVEKGNLLGAWGVVSHLEDAPGQEWTQVIKWLSQFASSLPLPKDCDLTVLSHKRMAVLASLRVELALRAKDIPRAVHGTVAFFEAALWDWLRQRDFAQQDGASGTLETGLTFTMPLTGEKKDRFKKTKATQVWRIDDFHAGVQAWLPVLNITSLSKIWDALTDDVRNLRNDVAHNEPTPELMNEARTSMQTATLWSNNDTFLSQKLVQDVLKELGEQRPEQLCDNLLSTVRQRLFAVS